MIVLILERRGDGDAMRDGQVHGQIRLPAVAIVDHQLAIGRIIEKAVAGLRGIGELDVPDEVDVIVSTVAPRGIHGARTKAEPAHRLPVGIHLAGILIGVVDVGLRPVIALEAVSGAEVPFLRRPPVQVRAGVLLDVLHRQALDLLFASRRGLIEADPGGRAIHARGAGAGEEYLRRLVIEVVVAVAQLRRELGRDLRGDDIVAQQRC